MCGTLHHSAVPAPALDAEVVTYSAALIPVDTRPSDYSRYHSRYHNLGAVSTR